MRNPACLHIWQWSQSNSDERYYAMTSEIWNFLSLHHQLPKSVLCRDTDYMKWNVFQQHLVLISHTQYLLWDKVLNNNSSYPPGSHTGWLTGQQITPTISFSSSGEHTIQLGHGNLMFYTILALRSNYILHIHINNSNTNPIYRSSLWGQPVTQCKWQDWRLLPRSSGSAMCESSRQPSTALWGWGRWRWWRRRGGTPPRTAEELHTWWSPLEHQHHQLFINTEAAEQAIHTNSVILCYSAIASLAQPLHPLALIPLGTAQTKIVYHAQRFSAVPVFTTHTSCSRYMYLAL